MEHLLDRSVQEFIRGFEGDPLDLALKGSPFDTVDVKELVQQVKGRSQIRKKLPLWYATSGIIYPPKLNLEQTSGQIAALYKASLCAGSAGAAGASAAGAAALLAGADGLAGFGGGGT